MEMGRIDSAISRLEQAQLENPDRHYILNNLANLKLDRGQHREAANLYRRAIEVYPERTESHHNLALCLLIQGDPEKAVEVLTAIPETKSSFEIRSLLTRALREKKRIRSLESKPSAEIHPTPPPP